MSFGYSEFSPSPRLTRYIECYWFRDDSHGTPGHRVLPDGCVDILFSRQNREPLALSVVGLMTVPFVHDVKLGESYFGVRFRPAMASALIREAGILNDRTEPLETFWGPGTRVIFDKLAECATPGKMIETLEPYLRPLEPPDALEKALSRLSSSRPAISSLASVHGLSPRHFRRGCTARTGVSPKMLSRILRFQDAVRRIGTTKGNCVRPDWARFAVACGYYDQAHFIREFQEFAGVTPGRYLQSIAPGSPVEWNP